MHLEDVLGPVYAISLASGDAWVSLGLRALAAGSCPVTSLANSSSNVLTVKQCCLWMHLDEQRVYFPVLTWLLRLRLMWPMLHK